MNKLILKRLMSPGLREQRLRSVGKDYQVR